jgi:hypothetical protein
MSPFQRQAFSMSPFVRSPGVDLDFSWLSEYHGLPSPVTQGAFVPDLQVSEAQPEPALLPASISSSNSSVDLIPESFAFVPVKSESVDDDDGSSSDDNSSGVGKMKKPHRRRKLTSELTPAELAKMREVNRIAAQRHRSIAKLKQSEQQQRSSMVGQRNQELRLQMKTITAELNTLRSLVLSVYGPGGPRHGALSFL